MDASSAKDRVRRFFDDEHGLIVALSQDKVFNKTLEGVVMRHSVSFQQDLSFCADTREALLALKGSQGRRVVLFAERQIFHKLTNEFISLVRDLYDHVRTIVITDEVAMDSLVFLHESGAHNVIIRPASMASVIEKIANALQPQGRLIRLIENAKRLLAERRPEEALEAARLGLELKPGSPAVLMLQGDALVQLSRFAEARLCYEEAHRQARLYLEPMKRLADLHERQGELDLALDYLVRLDRLSPMSTERKYRIARLYVRRGDQAEAQVYFDKAVECAVLEARTMVESLRSSIAEEAIQETPALSEKYLKELLESKQEDLSPSDVEIFNRLGLALRKQGKWEEAVSWYAKALEVAPFDSGVHYNMAMAMGEGGKFAEAAVALDNAMRISADFGEENDNLCYNIAQIYHRGGQQSKAARFLDKTLALNPRHKPALALRNSLAASAAENSAAGTVRR